MVIAPENAADIHSTAPLRGISQTESANQSTHLLSTLRLDLKF